MVCNTTCHLPAMFIPSFENCCSVAIPLESATDNLKLLKHPVPGVFALSFSKAGLKVRTYLKYQNIAVSIIIIFWLKIPEYLICNCKELLLGTKPFSIFSNKISLSPITKIPNSFYKYFEITTLISHWRNLTSLRSWLESSSTYCRKPDALPKLPFGILQTCLWQGNWNLTTQFVIYQIGCHCTTISWTESQRSHFHQFYEGSLHLHRVLSATAC